MRSFSVFAAAALTALASAEDKDDAYAPYNVSCPDSAQFVRKADSLSPQEKDWLKGRDPIQKVALVDWLKNSNLTDFDESSLGNDTIRVGLAFSGGGYRAMLSGGGQLAATDNRTVNATQQGHMGGLLQAATYVAGLSGGNWLLGSIVVNNFTSVQALQGDKDLWDLEHSIVDSGGINIFSTANRWGDLSDAIHAKKDAGFNTSVTDIWGRALSYQFFNGTHGGVDTRYHYVREYDAFKNFETFFPLHVADGRAPDTLVISDNSTVFEFNPFELGSWDPSLYAFTDIEFLGSQVDNGKPSQCVNGFDNVGFLVGTSSSLFNQFFLQLNGTSIPSFLKDWLNEVLEDLGQKNDDIAIYDPNPFSNVDHISNSISKNKVLDLVDGGEDGQNVPLYPLIQPERNVDIIFAFDNSADTDEYWANGTSLADTYRRQFSSQGNNTIFPYVPDADTLVYGGWTEQPTFFGCDRNNLTSLFNESLPESERHYPPVVVFIANTEHSYQGNTSTFKMSYEKDEVAGLINNGYNTFTQNNGTLDSEWRTCVACAVLLRSQQRQNVTPSDQCNKCFDKYCYNGKLTTASNGTIARRDGKSNLVNDAAVSGSAAPSGSAQSSGSAAASGSGSGSSSSKSKGGAASVHVSAGSLVGSVLGALLLFL